MAIRTTTEFRNDDPNTVHNRLVAQLGREPTHAETIAEVRRILAAKTAAGMVAQPCQQQQARAYTVTLYVEVLDEAAALEAGAQELVDSNSVETIDEARADIGGDVTKALRFVLDPGTDLDRPWLQINDSGCDEA